MATRCVTYTQFGTKITMRDGNELILFFNVRFPP